jgi:hypothetical protein
VSAVTSLKRRACTPTPHGVKISFGGRLLPNSKEHRNREGQTHPTSRGACHPAIEMEPTLIRIAIVPSQGIWVSCRRARPSRHRGRNDHLHCPEAVNDAVLPLFNGTLPSANLGSNRRATLNLRMCTTCSLPKYAMICRVPWSLLVMSGSATDSESYVHQSKKADTL